MRQLELLYQLVGGFALLEAVGGGKRHRKLVLPLDSVLLKQLYQREYHIVNVVLDIRLIENNIVSVAVDGYFSAVAVKYLSARRLEHCGSHRGRAVGFICVFFGVYYLYRIHARGVKHNRRDKYE